MPAPNPKWNEMFQIPLPAANWVLAPIQVLSDISGQQASMDSREEAFDYAMATQAGCSFELTDYRKTGINEWGNITNTGH